MKRSPKGGDGKRLTQTSLIRRKMRKIIAISAICFTGITVTACGKTETVYVERSTTTPKTTDAPIATAPETTYQTLPAEPAWTIEDEYLWDIESQHGPSIVDDTTLIETGYVVCDTLRAGVPVEQVALTLIESSGGNYQIQQYLTTVVASAIVNFCPEQQYQIG